MNIDYEIFFKLFRKIEGAVEGPTYIQARQAEVDALIALSNAFRPKRFLEVGINLGYTAAEILKFSPWIEEYVGIDLIYEKRENAGGQSEEVPESPGIMAAGDPRLKVYVSEYGLKSIPPSKLGFFDFIFIDGDHTYEGIKFDTMYCRAILKDGVMAWHDYTGIPGVTKFIDEVNMKEGQRIWWVTQSSLCFEICR